VQDEAGGVAVKVVGGAAGAEVLGDAADHHRKAGPERADAVIDTTADDDRLIRAFRENAGDGYDVVVDYLWGRPTELLTRALVPDSFTFPKPTRLVQIRAAAGPDLRLRRTPCAPPASRSTAPPATPPPASPPPTSRSSTGSAPAPSPSPPSPCP